MSCTALLFSVLAVSSSSAPVGAQAGNSALGNPYSPASGHPYRHGVVPTLTRAAKMKAYAHSHVVAAISSKDLHYQGGTHGVGVTSGKPRVYLVFWGRQWGTRGSDARGNYTFSGDPRGGAPYIERLFKGIGTGTERWSDTTIQYCDGPTVTVGATKCPSGSLHVGYPTGGALAGAWYDSSHAEPGQATAHQLAAEAVAAARHFGNTTPTRNRYTQYVILSPTGLNPDDYLNDGYCAWHDYTLDPSLDGGGAVASSVGPLAFTNLPYVMDLGTGCGAGLVNPGNALDGYSINAGHEYAETLTDQFPAGGWLASDGEEIGDLCSWRFSGAGHMADLRTTTGVFAMQGLWSNAAGGGIGGCAFP